MMGIRTKKDTEEYRKGIRNSLMNFLKCLYKKAVSLVGILLFLIPDDFTCKRRTSRRERINVCEPFVVFSRMIELTRIQKNIKMIC